MIIRKSNGLIVSLLVLNIAFFSTGFYSFAVEKDDASMAGGGYAVAGDIPAEDYMSELYDATNGLPTSEANYIFSASDGYMWICGYSGVYRYDGSYFDRLDSYDGLTNGRVLFEDSNHRMWVGTNDSGVVILEKGTRTNLTLKDGLPSSSIRTFAEDNEGNIYIGTTSGIVYANADLEIKSLSDERINSERILRMSADESGAIYGYTKKGDIFSISSGKIKVFHDGESLDISKVTNIYGDPDNEGYVYIGTQSGYIYYGQFDSTLEDLQEISVAPLGSVKWISKECGRIWVASETQLGYIDNSGKFQLVEDIPVKSSIEMFTTDYQGNIWLASSRQGVLKIVSNNFVNLTAKAGIDDCVVNATCLHGDYLYVGTDEGLYIIDKNYNSVTNDLTEYIGKARIRCIDDDDDGNLWFATFSNETGLVCVSKDASIKSYKTEDGMPSNEIRCIKRGMNGNLLVGTNAGIAVINSGEITISLDGDDLRNPVILDVEEIEENLIFASTDGDGIYAIRDGELEGKIGREDGLTSDVVQKVVRDTEREVLWVVTSNSIEYMTDYKVFNVSTFPYNNNYDIFADNSGSLWVLSSCGIFVVDAMQMVNDNITEYREYNLGNGMTSMPIANERSDIDDQGNLYIAGVTGVSKVNIYNFYDLNLDVRVDISLVKCDDEELQPDEDGTYTIPADVARMQITPAVLDYTMLNPRVKFFFEGANDSGLTTQRSKLGALDYTELRYGKYTMHIQILDNATGEVKKDKSFIFVKQPRFFERTSVRVMLIILLAATVGLIVWRVMTWTIIRRQYAEIAMAKDEAERANTAKSRFLANMSHEIRTPINTIMGMNEIILREDTEGVPKSYFMSVVNCSLDIRNAAESLLGLINEILDISKIESGKMHLVEKEYEPVEMFRSVISMIKVKSQEKDLTFTWNIDENLPQKLYGDDGKVKQIVLNLLTNAVKYTKEGGFTLKVSVEEQTSEECIIRISVKDTGIGVKKEDLDKLFTAYERLDEEKNSSIQGTGLGLDISRRFAELLNGKIWCESDYGHGSEFILICQQKIVDATPIGIFKEYDEVAARGPYVPQFIAPTARVLVVDDNTMNLSVFKGLIKPTKIQVETATSGKECLEKISTQEFDVVFLDHMMPEMDGLETLEKLREINQTIPVYAMTANTMGDPDKFYESKGFNGYLAKPIDTIKMEQTLMLNLEDKIQEKPADEMKENGALELAGNMLWVKQVDGISFEEGVKASGGMTSFIHSIELFYDTIDENSKALEDACNNGDFRLYTIKVHALKSSARIIGAKALSDYCEQMENAGKNDDIDFILANHQKLLEQYRHFKELLAPVKEKARDKEALPRMSDADLQKAYEALKESVSQMDYDACEMILSDLSTYSFSEEDASKIEIITKLLKQFDWDALEELFE